MMTMTMITHSIVVIAMLNHESPSVLLSCFQTFYDGLLNERCQHGLDVADDHPVNVMTAMTVLVRCHFWQELSETLVT